MKKNKEFRNITYDNQLYKWRVQGDDGHIEISIWPVNENGRWGHWGRGHHCGPCIKGGIGYHESNAGDYVEQTVGQVIISTRIIRQIIEHAIHKLAYNPDPKPYSGSENEYVSVGDLIDFIELKEFDRVKSVDLKQWRSL